MRREEQLLLLFFGLAGVGAYLWFTKSGQAAAQSAGEAISTGVTFVESLIRGERNNNPGNIRKSTANWQGKIVPSTDPSFEQFDTPENGIRALAVVLRNYQKIYGLNTVRGIVNRWAPPTENDTDSYVNAVARDMGVSADETISLYNPTTLFDLVKATIKHENGRVAYADSVIYDGISRALG